MTREFPDKVSPEEKARRRRVIRGWTDNLSEYNMRFPNHCIAYLKGYRDDPPEGYTDPEWSGHGNPC
jgi:hypothetical protein